MIRSLLVSAAAVALLSACGTTETRTTYYPAYAAPAPAYTTGYYVAPVVTVREPRYYNYNYSSYDAWRNSQPN